MSICNLSTAKTVYRLELNSHVIPSEELKVRDDVVYRYLSSTNGNKHIFLLFVRKIISNRVAWGGYLYNPVIRNDEVLYTEIKKVYDFLLAKYG